MDVPVKLSTNADECLRLLRQRREQLDAQIKEYKSKQLAEIEAAEAAKHSESSAAGPADTSLTEPLDDDAEDDAAGKKILPTETADVKAAIVAVSKKQQQFNDNNSEISSSVMDSNYESDHSLARSNTDSPSLNGHGSKRAQVKVKPLAALNVNTTTTVKRELSSETMISSPTTTTAVALSSSSNNNNSDDSDATIHDTEQRKISRNQSNASSQDSSERTTAAMMLPLPNMLIELTMDAVGANGKDLDDAAAATGEEKPAAQTATPKCELLRQSSASDGYSSCTPLSASSLVNETPTINPFFTSPAT